MMMNCERFRATLDQYIDSELSEEERMAMEEHTLGCDDCAELLNQALTTATLCAELNEGLSVPLDCQAAWRRAVREEAAQARKAPKWLIWRRTLSVAAAVLVLMLAVGTTLNPDSLSMMPAALMNGALYNDTAGGLMTAAHTLDAGEMRSSTQTGFRLESDGSLEGDVSVASKAGNTSSEDVIVLRSALRRVVTENFDNDLLWLDDLLREYDAYFENKTVSGQAEDSDRMLEATIRVPSESLDNFLTALDDMDTVTLREETAEDITADYTDVSTRLNVLRSQLDQLNAMNETAESVTDLIAIHERATELMAEIESYESTLRAWSSRRNYSTVTLTIEEKLQGEGGEGAPLGERMKEAFADSVAWLKAFAQNAAVLLAALAPRLVIWLPVAALLIVVICLIFRRKKK